MTELIKKHKCPTCKVELCDTTDAVVKKCPICNSSYLTLSQPKVK